MRFIGYNPLGQQVYEVGRHRGIVNREGELGDLVDKKSPTMCYFDNPNQLYDSLILYARINNKPLEHSYVTKFCKDTGMQWSFNKSEFAKRFFLRVKFKRPLFQADIRRANQDYNLIKEYLEDGVDFDTSINIIKLTDGMDHVHYRGNIHLGGRIPSALITNAQCVNHFIFSTEPMEGYQKRYLLDCFTNRNYVEEGAKLLIYNKGYTTDYGGPYYTYGLHFRVKFHCIIDKDEILLLELSDEENPGSNPEKIKFFVDMNEFFKFYKEQSPFKTKELELDQEEYFDSRVEKIPYVSLSKLRHPFTSAPIALYQATQKALNDFEETYGNIDDFVGNLLGFDKEKLIDVFTAEQMDAIGLWYRAHDTKRSFLLADQTGIGKGRALAAIAKIWLNRNPDNRVVYFTENTDINIPDVWRDLTAVGADNIEPWIVGGKKIKVGNIYSFTPKEKAALFQGKMADDHKRLVITNYSQFRKIEDNIKWLKKYCKKKNTLLILDESHNALTPTSNIGVNIRKITKKLKRNNVVFSTATPLRDIRGIDLYKSLLKVEDDFSSVEKVLGTMGNSSQEALVTTLAEDGTYLRRDHDLSGLEIKIDLPDSALESYYLKKMSDFSRVLKRIMSLKNYVDNRNIENCENLYEYLIAEGLNSKTAETTVAERMLTGNNSANGIVMLSRLFINSLKVEQAAQAAINEIKDGRKPMITFHSTNQALVKDAGDDLNFFSAIKRTADKIYAKAYKDNEELEQEGIEPIEYPEIEEAYKEVLREAKTLRDMTISPIDTLQEILAAEGISSEEISGRSYRIVEGDLISKSIGNKKDIVDRFNNGKTDILIYNQAGATGGSFHCSPDFKDQRPRTIIEMETPLDIIKYVQSQGRGNRYGQLHSPKLITVSSGLVPEMRIIQQRNIKLKKLGASVDGSRSSHPILAEEELDLLNSVGNRATAEVLRTEPDISEELGLIPPTPSYSSRDDKSFSDIANKVLSYAIILPAKRQKELFEKIKEQFKSLIDSLNEANKNPLQLKEIRYPIEIQEIVNISELSTKHKVPITGIKREITLSHGQYKNQNDCLTSYQIFAAVQVAKDSGVDGKVKEIYQHICLNEDLYLAPYVSHEHSIEATKRNAQLQSSAFVRNFDKLGRLKNFLKNFKCGAVYKDKAGDYNRLNVILNISLPDDPSKYLDLWEYKVDIASAGRTHVKRRSLVTLLSKIHSKLKANGYDDFSGRDFPRYFSREFDSNKKRLAIRQVQILGGNLMAGLEIAIQNNLSSNSLCLYKTTAGELERGIVIESEVFNSDSIMVKITDKIYENIVKKIFNYKRNNSVTVNLENKAKVSITHEMPSTMDEDWGFYTILDTKRMTEKQSSVFLNNNPHLKKYAGGFSSKEDKNMNLNTIVNDFKGIDKYLKRSTVKGLFEGATT